MRSTRSRVLGSILWSLILLVAGLGLGCGGPRPPEIVIAEPGGSFVRVDHDSSLPEGGYSHPASIPYEQLRLVLQAIDVDAPAGFLGTPEHSSLFEPEDVEFLANAVSEALLQANPQEHIVFYLRQPGRLLRPEVTTGAVAVMGQTLRVRLGHYREVTMDEGDNFDGHVEEGMKSDPLFGVHDVGIRLSVGSGLRWRPGETARDLVIHVPPAP